MIKTKHKMNIPKKVYCFWTGTNEFTTNRKRCLQIMIENIGVPVILVTTENLKDFIVPDYPLHKSYEYLSLTHRSDYLRMYFMHFYGGGYCDIKEVHDSWLPFFNSFTENEWINGFSGRPWNQKIGWSSMICKPNSTFTKEWFTLMNNFLDEKYEDLKKNPAEHYTVLSGYERPEYPIQWEELMSKSFQTIVNKYDTHVKDTLPSPYLEMYR